MVSCTHHEVCVIDHGGQVGHLTSHTNTSNPQQAAILSPQWEEVNIRRRPQYSDQRYGRFLLSMWQRAHMHMDFFALWLFWSSQQTRRIEQTKRDLRHYCGKWCSDWRISSKPVCWFSFLQWGAFSGAGTNRPVLTCVFVISNILDKRYNRELLKVGGEFYLFRNISSCQYNNCHSLHVYS